MITVFDIVTEVYSILHTGGCANVEKGDKPVDVQEDEYITINTLQANQTPVRDCPVNVNFHCKDLFPEKRISNDARLEEMTDFIIGLLEGSNTNGIDLELVFHHTLKDENLPQHYVNIRFIARYTD